MDNLTHSFAGWALGQAGLKSKTRKGLAALILAANMPDFDVFFGHSCWAPLATHRGVTHSLLGGLVVMPPVLAALLWLWDRWQLRRNVTFKSGLPMHFGWLVALCYLGYLTHPLLDLQTSYAVQLLSPFSNRWFHTESLFIIDVWLWFAMGLGIWLSRRRERRGGNWQKPARTVIGIALGYIAVNSLLTFGAMRILRSDLAGAGAQTVFAQFEPVKFWTRGLVYREQGKIGFARWSPFTGLQQISPPAPDNMQDPLVRRAMFATAELRRFMRWSVMPMATISRKNCRVLVSFTDARFAKINVPWRDDGNPFRHDVLMPSLAPGCAGRGE